MQSVSTMDNSSNFMQEVFTLIPFIFLPIWKGKRCTQRPEGKKERNQVTPKSKSPKKGGESFSKILRPYKPINFYNEFTEGKGIVSARHLPNPQSFFTRSFSPSQFFSERVFHLHYALSLSGRRVARKSDLQPILN